MLSLGAFAGSLDDGCARFNEMAGFLSEFKGSTIKREMLVEGHCIGQVLTFSVEGRPVLRLRLEGKDRFRLEGAIETLSSSKDGVFVEEGDKTALRVRGTTTHLIQSAAVERPSPITQFQVPTEKGRRGPYLEKNIPLSGRYGVARKGARFHTAIDFPADSGEVVLAPANGVVVLISHLKTQSTVFLKHVSSRGGKVFYSALAHLKEIKVRPGDQVTPMTEVGRVLNKSELARTHHAYNHVHMEVRKRISDLGDDYIHTRKRSGLDTTFINPSLPLEGDWSW